MSTPHVMIRSLALRRNVKCVVWTLLLCVGVLWVILLLHITNNDVTIHYNLYYFNRYIDNDVMTINTRDVIRTNDGVFHNEAGYQHGRNGFDYLGKASITNNGSNENKTSLRENVTDDTLKWKRDILNAMEVRPQNIVNTQRTTKPDDVTRGLNQEAKQALKAARTSMELHKMATREVVLTSQKTVSGFDDVTYPSFVEFGKPGYPGENGTGVGREVFNWTSKAEKKRRKKDFYINNFDVWVSRVIPLHRSLYEGRSDSCRIQKYNIPSPTPTVSVIIVFYNEAFTTLIRSIHSILDASPKDAITEIVLLDDCSTQDHLGEPLEHYLKTHLLSPPVRLVRSSKRLGLVRARNVGFLYSKGDVLVFLDSHIECFQGWFEPLIAPILTHPTTVTFPSIQIISTRSFKVIQTKHTHVGSLNLDTLAFAWRNPTDESNTNGDSNDEGGEPLYRRSPTMPGGLYAVSRKWFATLAGYDSGLEVWGAENIEISFKTWMCGGYILLSTCSNIGHVFRTSLPLVDPSLQEKITRNRQRVAEVWMDEYKHFFYEKLAYNLLDPGNLTNQRRLRVALGCHDFRWYLDHVNGFLKEEMDQDGAYSGMITHAHSGLCLQSDDVGPILMACRSKTPNQVWQLTTRGHLVSSNKELSVMVETNPSKVKARWQRVKVRLNELGAYASHDDDDDIVTSPANSTSSFRHHTFVMAFVTPGRESPYSVVFEYDKTKRLVHVDSHMCLEKHPLRPTVRLSVCDGNVSQTWDVQTRLEYRTMYNRG